MTAALIVALDGSELGERALDVAQPLARRLGVPLQLVRSSWDSTDAEAMAYLADVVERRGLPPETTTSVAYRHPPDAITELAAATPDAVVCMTSHGRTGLGHAVLGSVTEAVLARCPVPVLVVGPDASIDLERSHRLGLCLDASALSADAVPIAAQWARDLGMGLDVITVVPEDDRPVSRFHPATAAQVDAAVQAAKAADIHAHAHMVKELQPARGLARFAVRHHVALLVARTRAQGGLSRHVLGSTSMNLVRQSPCAVLFPPLDASTAPSAPPSAGIAR